MVIVILANDSSRVLGITSVRGKVTTRGKMMRSTLTAEYGAKMRQRVEAVKPKRHIKILTEASMGQSGSNLKMLQSGALQTNAGFNTAVSHHLLRETNFFCTETILYQRLGDHKLVHLRAAERLISSLSNVPLVSRETNSSICYSPSSLPNSRSGHSKTCESAHYSQKRISKRSWVILRISIVMALIPIRSV